MEDFGPAQKAGFLAGDRIYLVFANTQSTVIESNAEWDALINGLSGPEINVYFFRMVGSEAQVKSLSLVLRSGVFHSFRADLNLADTSAKLQDSKEEGRISELSDDQNWIVNSPLTQVFKSHELEVSDNEQSDCKYCEIEQW